MQVNVQVASEWKINEHRVLEPWPSVARLSGLWILSSFPDFGTTGKAMADK